MDGTSVLYLFVPLAKHKTTSKSVSSKVRKGGIIGVLKSKNQCRSTMWLHLTYSYFCSCVNKSNELHYFHVYVVIQCTHGRLCMNSMPSKKSSHFEHSFRMHCNEVKF